MARIYLAVLLKLTLHGKCVARPPNAICYPRTLNTVITEEHIHSKYANYIGLKLSFNIGKVQMIFLIIGYILICFSATV